MIGENQQEVKGTPLPREFYSSPDVVGIAKSCIGKFLCSSLNGKYCSGMIVETEAYRAPEDKASHAYNNRRTARTEIMFGQAGKAYIYLCYGIHHLFNIVTGPKEMAHAVLIRAIKPVDGLEVMMKRRGFETLHSRLTSGPGSLSRAMGLHVKYSGEDLVEGSRYWVEDRGVIVPDKDITQSPRVGVAYAEECAAWPWRFRLADSRWTSPAK